MAVRVFLADANLVERSAFRLLFQDLGMDLAGEAADWPTVLAQVPLSGSQLLVVDWDLLPISPSDAIEGLRKLCPASLIIVLISHLDSYQQSLLSSGADGFISRSDMAEKVVDRIRAVAKRINP